MLRLLPREEIDKRKAQERTREMNEGQKLAGRVDSLREMAVSEEIALDTYRTETLKKIQEEIQSKRGEYDLIHAEVTALKAERARLSEPLDSDWDKLHKAEDKCAKWEIALDDREWKMSDEVRKLSNLSKELEKVAKDTEISFLKVKNDLADAAISKKTARKAIDEAHNTAKSMLDEAKTKVADISKREKAVAMREYEVELVKKSNLLVRKANIADQIRLADREATLERGFAELKRKQK